MHNEFRTKFPHITKTHEWGLITKINSLVEDTKDIVNTSASAMPDDEAAHFAVTLSKRIVKRRFPDQSNQAIKDMVKFMIKHHS